MIRRPNPALEALQRRGNPDAAGHLRMNADGQAYAAPEADPLKSIMGMGHLDLGYLRSQANAPQRAGSLAGRQRLGMMARTGVEMGPVWNEIADLNRARRAMGGEEYDPVGDLAGAARQGAAAGNAAGLRTVTGNAARTAGDEALRARGLSLAEAGIDTERAGYELGPDWQRSPGLASYQWGEPPAAAFRRRKR